MKNFNTYYNCFSWSNDRQGKLCVNGSDGLIG